MKLSLDVDRDGRISPIDALILIDEINKVGTRRLLGSPDSVSFYLDPDNDGFLTPLDVLALVTWLNRSSGVGSGESNSDGPTESFLDSLATERQHNADVYFASYEEDLLPESLKRRRRGI
jgi:hypothetical protein